MRIKDAVVIVTGGASGIGGALVRRFASEGARHVAVVDLDGDGAEVVASEVGGTAFSVDVTFTDEPVATISISSPAAAPDAEISIPPALAVS